MIKSKRSRLTNLDQKALVRERVVVENDTASVAKDLSSTTSNHAAHETPALPSEAKVTVDDAEHREEDNEGDVGCERRQVAVHCPVERTDVEVAQVLRGEGIVAGEVVAVDHRDGSWGVVGSICCGFVLRS